MKSFSVALTYKRNEGNQIKTLSKLHANIQATSEEEAVGIKIRANQNLFENWNLCAVMCQEQVNPEDKETTLIRHADKLQLIRVVNLFEAYMTNTMKNMNDLEDLRATVKKLKENGF